MAPNPQTKQIVKRAAIVLITVAVAWVGWSTFKVWRAWQNVARIELNTGDAREALAVGAPTTTSTTIAPSTRIGDSGGTSTTTTLAPSPTLGRSDLTTFLVIGTDRRDEYTPSVRADVILLVMFPPDTDDAVMVSIPRDLYVDNPCTGTRTKINANLNGCGESATGPEQLAIAVEDFTGVPVDHFAMFDFEGFRAIIDRVGGVEICVGDNPVRDLNPDLHGFELPAGCSEADGDTALGWVRSRKTQHQVDGRWVPMPGVNDLTRNVRQQEMLLTALDKLKGVRSINELTGLVEDVADAFTIDDALSLGDAIGILWDVRSFDSEAIYRPAISVQFSTTDAGESILLPTATFHETLQEAYPSTDLLYGD